MLSKKLNGALKIGLIQLAGLTSLIGCGKNPVEPREPEQYVGNLSVSFGNCDNNIYEAYLDGKVMTVIEKNVDPGECWGDGHFQVIDTASSRNFYFPMLDIRHNGVIQDTKELFFLYGETNAYSFDIKDGKLESP